MEGPRTRGSPSRLSTAIPCSTCSAGNVGRSDPMIVTAEHPRAKDVRERVLEPFAEIVSALGQHAELAAGKLSDLGAPRFGREHQQALNAWHALRYVQRVKQNGAPQVRSVVHAKRLQ